jgi:hypothetical protein
MIDTQQYINLNIRGEISIYGNYRFMEIDIPTHSHTITLTGKLNNKGTSQNIHFVNSNSYTTSSVGFRTNEALY